MRPTAMVGAILIPFFLVFILSFTSSWADNKSSFTPSPPTWANIALNTILEDDWYNVVIAGNKVGFFHNKIEGGPTGYRISNRAVMNLSVAGQPMNLSFSKTYTLDLKRNVIGFVSLETTGNQRRQTIGKVEPGKIVMTVTSTDGTRKIERKIPPNTKFADVIAFGLGGKLAVGKKEVAQVFLPALRTVVPFSWQVEKEVTKEVMGKPTKLFLLSSTMQGLRTESYVTQEGRMVFEKDGLLGSHIEKVDEETAISMPSTSFSISSLISFSMIKPDKLIVNQQVIRKLDIIISGLSNPSAIPRDYRQSVGKPLWSSDKSGKRIMKLPVSIIRKAPTKRMTIQQAAADEPDYVHSTPEVQSDNRQIIAQAKRIVGDEKDALKAAQKINLWVFRNVRKKLVDSFTALDVLHSMEGECQSHTNLYTALARSIGIPTRISAGLVHSPEQKGFLYHAWPEVFVGEWVAIDPTLGQYIADPTHIKLAEGGVESSVVLLKFISKIGIEVK